MQLKSYQHATLNRLNDYLTALRAEQAKIAPARDIGIDDYEWDVKAWQSVSSRPYAPRRTGDGARVHARRSRSRTQSCRRAP